MDILIKAEKLGKSYRQQQALANISFELKAGQILGLLGHNGAGKSTLIKSLLGAHDYDGELAIFGLSPKKDRALIVEDLAYISDVAVLPEWMKVSQLLKYMSGVHPNFELERMRAFLNKTDIKSSSKIGSLSKGMKVQLHLAVVMSTDAKVLILDEPTLGLDLIYRDTFYRYLMEWFHDGDRALIIASHEVSEVEHLLSDVLILRKGEMVLQAPLEQVEAQYTQLTVEQHNLAQAQALKPIYQKSGLGLHSLLFENVSREALMPHGKISQPGLAEIFIAKQQEASK
ncbi:ABC transporter ATP-binding protein [Photobacterium lipolyticum]|uniref:Multidrug ABC transporter ATP-binding protein n=1 Tax=Photobacterium lipolyticum TaxID=266810 RepID=A0A2T3N171_9GAMM|nr:ABC transporter ATP-binding protein [Photobacterium lipolyticum]PSW06046.1 multidrug ABC transporter ATP-binding protein [Photobacterium lipolyticum]